MRNFNSFLIICILIDSTYSFDLPAEIRIGKYLFSCDKNLNNILLFKEQYLIRMIHYHVKHLNML